MDTWEPASRNFVERLLADQLAELSPSQRAMWQAIAVPLRSVEIANDPGQSVFVAAVADSRVLYFEDVEVGWNWAHLEADGRIAARGFEQDSLTGAQ